MHKVDDLILVCFALKEEAGAFRKIVADRQGVSILLTGMGAKNADRTVREYLKSNSPKLVLTCGFAGGLNPDLALGDVVFETQDPAFAEKLAAAGAKPASIFFHMGIATTAYQKKSLRKSTHADAVEMESFAIHFHCLESGIPCATVRVISDTANEDLPLDFNKLSNPDLSLNYGKLAAAILRNPSKIGALMGLQKNCRFAAQRLADVLVKVVLP